MGGERVLPDPDPVARDYLLLALRLGQHIEGLVDGYFGPADLKAQVDMEQLRPPARLADDAAALRERAGLEAGSNDRRDWLDRQLIALETQARALADDSLPYLNHVERCFDLRPSPHPDAEFRALANRLAALVPGSGPLQARLAELDDALTIPVDRLPAVAHSLIDRFRSRAAAQFGLPAGERLKLGLVREQPWSGYNWYEGGLVSRVDLNTDLPMRAPDLLHVVAHETYPGHHLEHAWKEADLVLADGRLEASVLLINTPECLISEGLADVGTQFATPADERAAEVAWVIEAAGMASPADAAVVDEIAEVRRGLRAVSGNAALMRHVEGRSHDEVRDYFVDVALMTPERAEKRLSFIEHPLWRTYVFVYSEGERLLERWLEVVPSVDRPARFGRLLHEQLTPSAVRGEIGEAASAASRVSARSTTR